MESFVPHVVAEPRPEESVRRLSVAAMLSVTIHLALVGYLWSAQPWSLRPFHPAGGKGSPPLSASFERPRPTDEAIVERVLPTQVRVEPDHAHVDRQMFVPIPPVDQPLLEPIEKQVEPHEHPHLHPHMHEPADVQSLTKPIGSTAPASVASAAAAAAQSVGRDETLPSLVFNPPPAYPSEARRAGLQGTVTLRVVVWSDGRVVAVEIFESSGHAILDEEAARAVRTWRFTPGRRNGAAAPFAIRWPVQFAL